LLIADPKFDIVFNNAVGRIVKLAAIANGIIRLLIMRTPGPSGIRFEGINV
jgi:succinyl-CoA synthetase beta subunit